MASLITGSFLVSPTAAGIDRALRLVGFSVNIDKNKLPIISHIVNMQYCTRQGLLAACCILIGACASPPKLNPDSYSGYLSDYSQLKSEQLESGRYVLRWTHPELKKRQYVQIILESVEFYPEPQVQKNVEREVLDALAATMNTRISALAESTGLPIADEAGPGTLRLRSAITAIRVEAEGFSANEVIPIRLIFSAVELAAGGRDQEVTIVLEYEMLDSLTGEVMTRGIRQGNTRSLANMHEKLIMEDAKELLDDWGMDFQQGFFQLKDLL